MLMRRNMAAGIGSSEQGEYCRAALQRSDRKEPRYKWPTFTLKARKSQNFPTPPFFQAPARGEPLRISG